MDMADAADVDFVAAIGEDLLGDDLGEHSLADYNLGNEEEEQLLADDYESGPSQNVPPSIGHSHNQSLANEYPARSSMSLFDSQGSTYSTEECVVPNLTVETPSYAPYEPPPYVQPEPMAIVPPPILAAPLESPQIVPSEINEPVISESISGPRFTTDRPLRTPRVRDLPDTLDKVLVPRSNYGPRTFRTTWRNPHYNHPYRKHNTQRGHFLQQSPSFPPPQMRPAPPLRPESPQRRLPPVEPQQIRNEPPRMRFEPSPLPPEPIPEPLVPKPSLVRPDMPRNNAERNEMGHFKPMNQGFPPRMPSNLPRMPPNQPNFRPSMDDRPNFAPRPPPFERPQQPFHFQPRPGMFGPRPFPPQREISLNNMNQAPQVVIRQPVPHFMQNSGPKMGTRPDFHPPEQEVRMLPVQLPPNLAAAGLPSKKVLINPHFKGNFQAPVDGIATYIPTKIRKSPPHSPNTGNVHGAAANIEDAAERFIAEQRNALARAANRKYQSRSPQRYIENTTIEIENELARGERARRRSDDDLLRRQEEFINANRAGLRRRMRSPSPPPAPRRRPRTPPPQDEESEYRRKLREQESLRERVLRAKEVRRRKNAVQLHRQLGEREKERTAQDKDQAKPEQKLPVKPPIERSESVKTKEPEKEHKVKTPDRELNPQKESTIKKNGSQMLTPPRETVKPRVEDRAQVKVTPPSPKPKPVTEPSPKPKPVKEPSPKPESDKEPSFERDLTPPLPIPEKVQRRGSKPDDKEVDYDFDDLDLILDDFEGILSDDEDTGRFKEKPVKVEPPKPKAKSPVDLRSKLATKNTNLDQSKPPPRQKIVFHSKADKKKKLDANKSEEATIARGLASSDNATNDSRKDKAKSNADNVEQMNKRQRIVFENTNLKFQLKEEEIKSHHSFSNRRVVLQRKLTIKPTFTRLENDPTKPNVGIFSRAIRNLPTEAKVKAKVEETETQVLVVEEEEDDGEEEALLRGGEELDAVVTNLPHGITDTRLKTLAGADVQNINLNKENRWAKLTFKTTAAAAIFKKKFNNKMVAASRLTVTLQ